MTRSDFNLSLIDLVSLFTFSLPVLEISICLIVLGYLFFISVRETRLFWLVCILGMHAAIGLAMGMYLFALVMIVLNLAAFGIGMSSERPFTAEVTLGRGTAERTGISGRAALGVPPLRR